MRDRLLKISVDSKHYEVVHTSFCGIVEFMSMSDHETIRQGDFIVFTDGNRNESLRNMWEVADTHVHFTSVMNISENFSLIVVLTNLYESIMHLRHGAFTEKKFFVNNFPIEMVEREVCIIQLCTDLLEGTIYVNQFIDELEVLTENDTEYCLEASAAIMKMYPWHCALNEYGREAIGKLRRTTAQIRSCMCNKREWRNIWKLAYSIHNEPSAIYESLYG